MSTYQKTAGSQFLYDSATNDIAGLKDSDGSEVMIPRFYGMFHDNNTQTNAGATSANVMNFRTIDFSKGISIASNTRITMANDGVYNIQFSSQFSRASGSGFSTVDIWFRKNGVNIPESNTQQNVPQSGGKAVAAWNILVSANAGDYYEICWSSSDTDLEMWCGVAGTNPTRPEIPAVILTVTQVGG